MADGQWLDDFTRGLGQAASRRATARYVAAAIVAGVAAAVSPSFAPTKNNNKGKKRKNRRRKKRKNRGKTQPGGSCSTDQTPEGEFLLVEVSENFEGKTLTLGHRTAFPSSGDHTASTNVKLGQTLVLEIESDFAENGGSRVQIHYGTGFTGVGEAEFIADEDMVRGSIDGRNLDPRSIEDATNDPDGWQFEDGGPTPNLSVDRALQTAVKSMLERAKEEVATCGQAAKRAEPPTPPALQGLLRLVEPAHLFGGTASAEVAALPLRGTIVCESASNDCLFCYGKCDLALAGCLAGSALFGIPACIEIQQECIESCDEDECCPVACGSNKPNSCCCDGETCCEGTCCEEDEACWPGGVCCKKGRDFCLGDCCPKDTLCKDGICCGQNEEPCFGECCPSGTTCREKGLCCPDDVVGCAGVCCRDADDVCQDGDVCCPRDQIVCAGACCPGIQDICQPQDGGDGKVCCPPDVVCGQVCCDPLSRCTDESHSTCCPFAFEICNGMCCHFGEVCLSHICCPGGQVCGGRCCPTNHFCEDPQTEECRACGENEFPCPLTVSGAPDCCPQGTQCCGNGTCCDPGVPCCDQGAGPQCDPTCFS